MENGLFDAVESRGSSRHSDPVEIEEECVELPPRHSVHRSPRKPRLRVSALTEWETVSSVDGGEVIEDSESPRDDIASSRAGSVANSAKGGSISSIFIDGSRLHSPTHSFCSAGSWNNSRGPSMSSAGSPGMPPTRKPSGLGSFSAHPVSPRSPSFCRSETFEADAVSSEEDDEGRRGEDKAIHPRRPASARRPRSPPNDDGLGLGLAASMSSLSSAQLANSCSSGSCGAPCTASGAAAASAAACCAGGRVPGRRLGASAASALGEAGSPLAERADALSAHGLGAAHPMVLRCGSAGTRRESPKPSPKPSRRGTQRGSVIGRPASSHELTAAETLSAAEEAKRSASERARRIALAAEQQPARACGFQRAVEATDAGSDADALSLGSAPDGAAAGGTIEARPPQTLGRQPSQAELAKRRAEEAAREIAAAAVPSPKPRGWCDDSAAAAAALTEAEAAKHRASEFAKALADRFENERHHRHGRPPGRSRMGVSSTAGPAACAATMLAPAATPSQPSSCSSPPKSTGHKAWLKTLLKPEHRDVIHESL